MDFDKYINMPQAEALKLNPHEIFKKPPCEDCEFWYPQYQFTPTDYKLMYNGVRCCWNNDSCTGFSCFKPRKWDKEQ